MFGSESPFVEGSSVDFVSSGNRVRVVLHSAGRDVVLHFCQRLFRRSVGGGVGTSIKDLRETGGELSGACRMPYDRDTLHCLERRSVFHGPVDPICSASTLK